MLWRSFCYGCYFDLSPATDGWLLGDAFLALCSLEQTARFLLAAANPSRPWPMQVRASCGKCPPTITTHHPQAPGKTLRIHENGSCVPRPLGRMVRTWKQALFIVQPETLLRWHRQGFKLLWKYKSRAASPTPRISAENVALIKEMARDNRLWGAERIRGELLKLGIRVCKRTIQKYMRTVRTQEPRGQ
jgi:hypothetical protein